MDFARSPATMLAKDALLFCVFSSLGLIVTTNAFAANYYVATTGSDSNPGTLALPFATLQKGASVAVAGDTVYIRGGTYNITTPANSGAGIVISKSGTSDANRIRFWAYGGEIPVFDFSKMTVSTTGYTTGFAISGSWLHFKGLEICNVPMNTRSNSAVGVSDASNDIFELLNIHHNNGTGIFFSHGTGGHLVLNCDSHDNYDPTSSQGNGENADGFGVHYQESGPSTIIRGCRAWWNSDDGYDFISQEVPVTIENSWAVSGGYINSGTGTAGNGNGFKIGSSKTGIRHVVRNCVAWKNRASGFYANHSAGGNTWYNNTSYNNGTQYNMLASTWDAAGNRTDGVILTGSKAHIMRNNIGFPLDNTNMGGVDSAFNTWDLSITPSVNDFASVTDTGLLGPRQADGSLPNLDFMKLKVGSQMIDKGTNVQLPFVGAAPDLGAYEFGATATGAGGSAGTGGTISFGGAAAGGMLSNGGRNSGGNGGAASGGASIRTGGAGGVASSTGGTVGNAGSVNLGGASTGTGGSGVAIPATGGIGAIGSGGTPTSTGGVLGNGGSTPLSAGGAAATGTGGRGSEVFGAGGGATATTGIGGATGGQNATGLDSPVADSGCSCVIGPTSGRGARASLVAMLVALGVAVNRRRRGECKESEL